MASTTVIPDQKNAVWRIVLPLYAALAIGTAMLGLTLTLAITQNGGYGFPLDDAWIHLQFARNLNHYHVFSYFQDKQITSGTTSPLYTIIVSIIFYIINNEFILSYFVGSFFFILSGGILFYLLRRLNIPDIASLATVVLLLLEPHLVWAALSGMETTMFIALLLGAWVAYEWKKSLFCGILCAGLVWTRPEGILFAVVLLADYFYRRYVVRPEHDRKKKSAPVSDAFALRPMLLSLGLGILAYAAFNYYLSGSLFPNTMAAKIRFYRLGQGQFGIGLMEFLTGGPLRYFSIAAAIGVLDGIVASVRRRQVPFLIPILWSSALIAAFAIFLPVVYQEGRYLMPVLPFYLLLGARGILVAAASVWRFVSVKGSFDRVALVAGSILGIFLFLFGLAAWEGRTLYADNCRYITDRQVRTGMWIRDHLPADAVVATHDVGAIAFYSGRRIVDMVGLVSPEMIPNIGSLDRLKTFLAHNGVTHLAVLRNWFEIDNEPLLFSTGDEHPEIVDVLPFHAESTHFVPQDVTRARDEAKYYYSIGAYARAEGILRQVLQMDPGSARSFFWCAVTFMAEGKVDAALVLLKEAVTRYPDYIDAERAEAEIAARRGRPQEAIAILESVLISHPDNADCCRSLGELYGLVQPDSLKSKEYFRKYADLQGRRER